MDYPAAFQRVIECIAGYIGALGRRHLITEKLQDGILEHIYKDIYRKYQTKTGISFISQYEKIYTTRMHVMILAELLDKPVEWIDNSYC